MAWNRWYSLKSYLKSALWIVPFFAFVAGRAMKWISEKLGGWMVSQGFYDLKTGFLAMDPAEANSFLDRGARRTGSDPRNRLFWRYKSVR